MAWSWIRWGTVATGLLGAAGACGSSSPSSRSEGPWRGDAASTGSSWSPVCPETAPTEGSACDVVVQGTLGNEVSCEYGDAWWDVACDTLATCVNSAWSIQAAGRCLPKPGANPAWCPATAGDAPATCSADGGSTCYYGTEACACAVTGYPYPPPDAGPVWSCSGAGRGGCPMGRPRIGSPCSTPRVSCDTGGGVWGEQCLGGTWQVPLGGP